MNARSRESGDQTKPEGPPSCPEAPHQVVDLVVPNPVCADDRDPGIVEGSPLSGTQLYSPRMRSIFRQATKRHDRSRVSMVAAGHQARVVVVVRKVFTAPSARETVTMPSFVRSRSRLPSGDQSSHPAPLMLLTFRAVPEATRTIQIPSERSPANSCPEGDQSKSDAPASARRGSRPAEPTVQDPARGQSRDLDRCEPPPDDDRWVTTPATCAAQQQSRFAAPFANQIHACHLAVPRSTAEREPATTRRPGRLVVDVSAARQTHQTASVGSNREEIGARHERDPAVDGRRQRTAARRVRRTHHEGNPHQRSQPEAPRHAPPAPCRLGVHAADRVGLY